VIVFVVCCGFVVGANIWQSMKGKIKIGTNEAVLIRTLVEQVTQCVVDSTKILGYVTVEYYHLYYSNICSYLVEYISRYSDSAYAAV
jgi:hypothetical protein